MRRELAKAQSLLTKKDEECQSKLDDLRKELEQENAAKMRESEADGELIISAQ